MIHNYSVAKLLKAGKVHTAFFGGASLFMKNVNCLIEMSSTKSATKRHKDEN